MTQTTRWLTYSAVADRLGKTIQAVEAMAASGELERRLIGDHYSISETSVIASELATRSGDVLAEHATKPTWKPWSGADFPDDRREQEDQ